MGGLFLLLFIVNLGQWLRKKTSKNIQTSGDELSERMRQQKIKSSLKDLLTCCKTNNPREIQAALLVWSSNFLNQDIQTIGQIKANITDKELKNELGKLESLLYSSQSNSLTWDSTRLAELVKNYETNQPSKKKETKSLAPLYPST